MGSIMPSPLFGTPSAAYPPRDLYYVGRLVLLLRTVTAYTYQRPLNDLSFSSRRLSYRVIRYDVYGHHSLPRLSPKISPLLICIRCFFFSWVYDDFTYPRV